MLCLTHSVVYGQAIFPAGTYWNAQQLKSRQPVTGDGIYIVRRTAKDLNAYGGNEYKAISDNDLLGKDTLEKSVYAVSTGDSLYLNTKVHQLPSGYSPALAQGRYIPFKTVFREKIRKKLSPGIGIKSYPVIYLSDFTDLKKKKMDSKKPAGSYILVLDAESGNIFLLDRNFILNIIREFPLIEYQYSMELEQNTEETFLKYIRMVDQALEH